MSNAVTSCVRVRLNPQEWVFRLSLNYRRRSAAGLDFGPNPTGNDLTQTFNQSEATKHLCTHSYGFTEPQHLDNTQLLRQNNRDGRIWQWDWIYRAQKEIFFGARNGCRKCLVLGSNLLICFHPKRITVRLRECSRWRGNTLHVDVTCDGNIHPGVSPDACAFRNAAALRQCSVHRRPSVRLSTPASCIWSAARWRTAGVDWGPAVIKELELLATLVTNSTASRIAWMGNSRNN